jgi:hypothetical protein
VELLSGRPSEAGWTVRVLTDSAAKGDPAALTGIASCERSEGSEAMAACFCGCGRRIGRFPLFVRSANNVGQDVAQRLAWARAVIGEKLNPEWAAEGEDYLRAIRDALHRQLRNLPLAGLREGD